MDVCVSGAISMRFHRARNLEGQVRTHCLLYGDRTAEPRPAAMMTFPYLASPQRCDGCNDCVRECPVGALELARGEFEVSALLG